MITPPQLELLRRIAEAGQQADMDVGIGPNVLLALLNELAALRARLAAAERIVWPSRCPGCGMVHVPEQETT